MGKLRRRRRSKNGIPGKLIRVAELIFRTLSGEAKKLIASGLSDTIKNSIGKVKKNYINVIRTPLNSNPNKIGTRRIVGGLSVRVDNKTGKEYFKNNTSIGVLEYLKEDGTLNYDNQGRLLKVKDNLI